MKTLKLFFFCVLCAITAQANNYKSIRDFNVLPTNTPEVNKQNLQKAIDWAAQSGTALFVDPSETPYPVNGGIILKKNVSLIGVHGPTGRGAKHPSKNHPVGSVFSLSFPYNRQLKYEVSNSGIRNKLTQKPMKS